MEVTEEKAVSGLEEQGATLKYSKGGKVLSVDFRSARQPLGEDTWQMMGCFSSLRELYLAGQNVGDDVLTSLEGLDKLTTLDLQNTQVTDEGLKTIKALPGLKLLLLSGSGVTREGVADVRKSMLKTRIVLL